MPKLPLIVLLGAAGAQALLSQAQAPWTLWPGLALAAWTLWKFSLLPGPKGPTRPLAPAWEAGLFLAILALGLFFRTYRLSGIPAGLPADQGFMGLSALWVLRDGWNPFPEIYRSQVPDLFPPLALSTWFRFVDPSLLGFRLFFAVLSLASFPFLYWTFRQLSGPRVALLSLFLFSVMRWDWVLARNSQPALETVFFLSSSLAFFLHGLSKRSLPYLSLGALISGAGVYAYPSLKVLPLLLGILAWGEFRRSKAFPKKVLLAPFFVLLLACLPRLADLAFHSFPEREAGAFLGTALLEKGSLSPLLSVWGGTALMFNRSGDPSPWYNVGGHRMLDDGTGALFLLGLAWAWRKRKDQEGSFSWAGLTVMALPGLLSVDPAASHRLAGMAPFVAYLAAGAGLSLWDRFFPREQKGWALVLGAVFLLLISAQNAWTYFHFQAKDAAYRDASWPAPTRIGLEIAALEKKRPKGFDHWVDPKFSEHPTLRFLTWNWMDRVGKLEVPDWARNPRPGRTDGTDPPPSPLGAALYLDGPKRGAPGFLAGLFPGSSMEVLQDEQGPVLATKILVPQEALAKAPAWGRGLKGEYSWPDPGEGKWAMADRIDPLVDFSHWGDFYFAKAPFRVRWTGTLEVPVTGEYLFHLLSSDKAALWLDGRSIALESPIRLARGPHALKMEFVKEEGYYPALHFIWKRPGADPWEVVPASAFGKPPQ